MQYLILSSDPIDSPIFGTSMSDNRISASDESIHFLSDDPIDSNEQDSFNHIFFAEVIENAIKKSRQSVNVGLYGKWGVGKSSVLKLFLRLVTKDPKYSCINIDVWKLSPDLLKQELLVEINNSFQPPRYKEYEITDLLYNVTQSYPKKNVRRRDRIRSMIPDIVLYSLPLIAGFIAYLWEPARPYLVPSVILSSIPAAIVSFGPGLISLVSKFNSLSQSMDISTRKTITRPESSHQFLEIFREIVNYSTKLDQNLIIILDNLDRCEHDVVIKLLGMIKTFMNSIDKCKFVIACDDEAIENHLRLVWGKADPNYPRDFLTKFFQITIRMPPFSTEQLSDYTNKLIREAVMPVDKSASEVIALTMTKTPRKIKQILNNLTTLYLLAEIKEKKKLILIDTITANTKFLAKIILLRDDYPKFYNLLQFEPDLLETMEQYITARRSFDEEQIKRIETILSNNPGLREFLRNTLGVTSREVQAFLTLSQERFEIEIPDRFEFDELMQRGYHNYLLGLHQRDPTLVELYINRIFKLIDDNIKWERYAIASNCISVLIEVFEQLPKKTQSLIIDSLKPRVQLSGIKDNIKGFNMTKFLKMLPEFGPYVSTPIFILYAKQLTQIELVNGVAKDNLIVNDRILDGLINSRKYLHPDVEVVIDERIAALIKKNEDIGFESLSKLFSGEIEPSFVLVGSIDALIEHITPILSPDIPIQKEFLLKRIDRYMKLKQYSTDMNKSSFSKKMVELSNYDQDQTKITANKQIVIDVSQKLTDSDLTPESSQTLCKAWLEIYDKLTSQSDKTAFVECLIFIYNNLVEGKVNVTSRVGELISTFHAASIVTLIEDLQRHNTKILENEDIIDNFSIRIAKEGPMDSRIIEYLIQESPKNMKNKIANILIGLINTRDPNKYRHATDAIRKFYNGFPEILRVRIKEACEQNFTNASGDDLNDLKQTAEILAKSS
jgi:Cdc6-like AAA superfamily ATPase